MKLKDRWYVAGEVRSEDYFAVKVCDCQKGKK